MIPSELPAGLLYLEVQRGSFMGPPLPLLVASTSSLASEAAIMLQRTVPSDHQGLTMDLAWLLQHVMDCQMGPRYVWCCTPHSQMRPGYACCYVFHQYTVLHVF